MSDAAHSNSARLAFLPAQRVQAAYEEAVRLRYLWHEFGDLSLIV